MMSYDDLRDLILLDQLGKACYYEDHYWVKVTEAVIRLFKTFKWDISIDTKKSWFICLRTMI